MLFRSNLARALESGDGVGANKEEALLWYEVAVLRSPPGAERDRSARNRDQLVRTMPANLATEVKRRALNWKPTP